MVQYNVGQGVAGAGSGAMAGSAGGPVGMGIGAILGALGGFGGGSKSKFKKIDTMTPEQQQQLSQLLQILGPEGQLGQGYQQGLGGLLEMMDPSSAAQQRFAEPYMQQFEQQTVPELSERFAGAGAQGGALSSSGFGQALGGAAAGLQTQLAGLKSQLQQSAIKDILAQYQGLSGQAFGASPFGIYQQPGQQGLGSSMLQGYAQQGFPGAQQGFKNLADLWSNYGPIIGNV